MAGVRAIARGEINGTSDQKIKDQRPKSQFQTPRSFWAWVEEWKSKDEESTAKGKTDFKLTIYHIYPPHPR